MNDGEAVSTAANAKVAMKDGSILDKVNQHLQPLRAQQGFSRNVSVAFFSQVGARPLSAAGLELAIAPSMYPAYRDPTDRDVVDICAAPGSLASSCENHHKYTYL